LRKDPVGTSGGVDGEVYLFGTFTHQSEGEKKRRKKKEKKGGRGNM
jgi:hypothetical protein